LRAAHDLGAFGNGSRMKYVANLLVAINNVASAEAMVLGLKAGLDARTVFEMVRSGAARRSTPSMETCVRLLLNVRQLLAAKRGMPPSSSTLVTWYSH